ncbi:hypothetical protein PIB30_057031 [Stylosanthes scabra]|uniref:Protein kinase domain-containing protein n=1 Tax=Stylosanthes scabra TaxID=79078 RepID=A0ABU6SJJ2_9FABA|nr:hypothetical protein [Stylosanthes scabra]
MAYLKARLKDGIISICCMVVMWLGCVKSNNGEGEYMLKLMNAVKPTPSDWSISNHICQWSGVTCNNQTGRIERLDLSSMSLRGRVPSGINDSLTHLKYLDLSNNYLSGPVPSLANLTFLDSVALQLNNFNSIPHGCFHALTSLHFLSLYNNTKLLPWNFPTDLTAHSSQLNVIDLAHTNLMGSVPNISHFFPAMQSIFLSNNNLSSIPEGCFHNLTNLTYLSLSNHTNLTPWTFPELIQSKDLFELNLAATNVMGSLPSEIFQSMPNLQIVDLSNNNLSGILPESRDSKINILHLNDQKGKGFSGTIDVLSDMYYLSQVWLQGNSFEGSIPDFSSSTALQDLQLAYNRLTGVVPDSLIRLSDINLQSISLNNNFLQGPVPRFYIGSDNDTNSFCRNNYEPCDQRVTILLEIASAFGYPYLLARSWRGNNPCHNWSFVACTGDMITTVNLTRLNLNGTISPAFANLTHLENLYLSGNNLNGSIPQNLTTLDQLKNLDVSNNNLSGKIPNFSSRVNLNTKGNPSFHIRNPSIVKRNPHAWIPGLSAAIVVGILLTFVVVIYKSKRLQKILFKRTTVDRNVEDLIQSHRFMVHKRYSYSQLKRITNSFREKLGQGGFGAVYKGTLSDGRQVAVKILKESEGNGEDFINEVASINRTSHVNIVPFLGFCYETNKRALIYEFMPNGSLDKFVDEKVSFCVVGKLDWSRVYQIIIGIARGLEYLHWGCSTKILHLDIKPQNILLDEDFVPKIADFGLAKLCTKKESIISLQCARGTPGYIAPKVYNQIYSGVSRRVSDKFDVYSYGRLILAVVGGKKNYNSRDSQASEMFFTEWIYKELETDNLPIRCLMNTKDENDDELVKKIILVGLWCIQRNPSERPSMKRVIEMLEGPLDSIPFPPKPLWCSPQGSRLQSPDIACDNTNETDSLTSVENDPINPEGNDQCSKCTGSGGLCGSDGDGHFSCLCNDGFHSNSCSESSSKWNWRLKTAIGATTAGVGIVVVFAVIICNRMRYFNLSQRRLIVKETGESDDQNVEDFITTYGFLAPKRYNYSEVKKITNSFCDQLGKGGYGVVYKGKLSNGRLVAVKVINESKGSGEEFINEVASISRTSHVNIVSLLGFCNEGNKRALIYEFVFNGSLDRFIYDSGSSTLTCNLDWNTLYQIAIGIARGLEYLHRGCGTRILHLDIKPQNILLDEDFCPKISDFGLAKICQKKESIVSILGTRGTIGYIAPEVFSRMYGGVSHKSDVYSYGMLILEMVGGRQNYESEGSNSSEMYFPDWIYKDLEQGNIPSHIRSLVTDEENDLVKKTTLVSLWCIQTNPSERPSINKVVEMLEGELHSIPFPPKPFLYSTSSLPLQISHTSSSNMDESNEAKDRKAVIIADDLDS